MLTQSLLAGTMVRVVHIPTGLEARSGYSRSAYRNKNAAVKLLAARLWRLRQEQSGQVSQPNEPIRTYVIDPDHGSVTDHRTGFSTTDVAGVLDGNIDDLLVSRKKCP